jgi:hypothetical protein
LVTGVVTGLPAARSASAASTWLTSVPPLGVAPSPSGELSIAPGVADHAGAVDHERVRRVGGAVGLADLAVLVAQDRVRELPLLGRGLVDLERVALLAGRA